MNKLIFLFILLIFSCSDKKKSDLDINKFKVSTLNGYVDDEIINIKKLDSSSVNIFDSWNLILIISSKFNSFNKDIIDHKSVINSIKQDLEKITIDNIPPLFNRPEIIGRLRVLKTFVYKIDSYNLNYENIEMYKSDLKLMFSSYDALISKMNSIDFD
tara:strand:+ start:1877 stop:2350 length:474 start_codon:yes stop_codon:yes gene_type:complete